MISLMIHLLINNLYKMQLHTKAIFILDSYLSSYPYKIHTCCCILSISLHDLSIPIEWQPVIASTPQSSSKDGFNLLPQQWLSASNRSPLNTSGMMTVASLIVFVETTSVLGVDTEAASHPTPNISTPH